MLVDVHSHLMFEDFNSDLDKVIERARKANLSYIICSGVNHSTNLKALNLAKKYDIIKASLGIYPLDAVGLCHSDDVVRGVEELNVDEEIKFIKKNKDNIIAIGEVGLDASPENPKLEEQKEVLWKIIKLAEDIKKPLVVHTRKAERECIEILESSKLKNVVLHCFTGNLKLVKKAEDLGFYLSIPAVVTRLKHFQEVIERTSLNSLLTETDAPYLSPYKGERNEPSYIKETIEIIAKIKNITKEEAEKIIFSNFQKVFLRK